MKNNGFKKVSINELITYSKQKEAPTVTIIGGVTKEELEYIELVSKRLYIKPIIVKKTNMVAFISNYLLIKQIAKKLKKKYQIMYYDFFKRPSGSIAMCALAGYTKSWVVLRDEGYKVFAFDEKGRQCSQWLNTNVRNKNPKYLNSLGYSKFNCLSQFIGCGNNTNTEIIEHSRNNYINDGIYNEERNCYYPSGESNKDIAEKNKLEKLFKKWGFKSL